MRTIKFRAWDGNVMIEHGKFNMHMSNNGIILGLQSGSMLFIKKENQLMQFTGLKDKNGKEIYEGDILTCTVVSAVEGYEECMCWVEYENKFGMFTISSKNKNLESDNLPHLARQMMSDNWWLPLMDIENIEIIGNIHKNEELIS